MILIVLLISKVQSDVTREPQNHITADFTTNFKSVSPILLLNFSLVQNNMDENANHFLVRNVWSIKIRTTHNLSLWLYEYFGIILLYGHLVYIALVLTWEICNMKWVFAKKVIIKSQRQIMCGSNFYGSDVIYRGAWKNKYGLPWQATACHGLNLIEHSDRACCFLNLVSGKIFKELYSIYKQDLFMIFPTFPKTN